MYIDIGITLNENCFKWNHVIVGWVSSVVTSAAQVGACVARESASRTVLCARLSRSLAGAPAPIDAARPAADAAPLSLCI